MAGRGRTDKRARLRRRADFLAYREFSRRFADPTCRISERLSLARHRRLRIITSLLLPIAGGGSLGSHIAVERNPLFLYLRLASLCSSPDDVPFSLLYSRVHAYSLSFPVSLLAIFHASTGWHVRRRILRNSMEIARVPETALERISRHRVSQRRTPRLDIPIRYTAGTWGARTVKLAVIEGETDRERTTEPSERKRKRDSFGG